MGRLLWVVAFAIGCDDTVFPTPERDYPDDWLGTQILFFDHCMRCHPTVQPTLDLPGDVFDDVCSETFALVVPGDPSASLLWRVMADERLPDDPPLMPFGVTPLRRDQLEPFRQWIVQGAWIEECP